MNFQSITTLDKICVIGISIGLVMVGWTGLQTRLLYFVIALISILVFLSRIFRKSIASGVRCWILCISILISTVVPIFLYDGELSRLSSTGNSSLSTLFDLTKYFPYTNLEELIKFNFESAFKWILAIVVFRTICSHFTSEDYMIRNFLIRSWIFGVLVNVIVQIFQFLNIFPIFEIFSYDYHVFNNRFPGLSDHPNTISIIVCLSVPLLYFSGLKTWYRKYFVIVFLISQILAQSRIGIVTFSLTLILCNWSILRKKFFYIAILCFVAILLWLLYKMDLFNSFIDSSRFNSSNIESQKSNLGRWTLMNFGLTSFFENPFFGVGPRAFKESHNIYIQVLASLGIFGLVGLFDFLIRPLFLKTEVKSESNFARICIFSFMFFGLFNNKLVDFYLYFPLMISLQVLKNSKIGR